jgi:hypothetical protein
VTSTAAREFEAPAPAGHPEPASGPEVSARKAYELTDARGHRARVWWNDGTLAVDADDAALRRRVRRALRKPIWSREDVVDEFGVQSSTLVELQPDDPRYINRLRFRWGQIGLRDLRVEVVPLSATWPGAPALTA